MDALYLIIGIVLVLITLFKSYKNIKDPYFPFRKADIKTISNVSNAFIVGIGVLYVILSFHKEGFTGHYPHQPWYPGIGKAPQKLEKE